MVTTRTVTTYVPQACAADGNGYAEYFAYGDFDPPAPPQTGHFFSDTGEGLPEVYGATRALVVTAGENGQTWLAQGLVPATGDVSVLLLPTLASCPLSTPVSAPGGARTGSVIAPIGNERVLVVGGAGDPVPVTYVARLDTGEVDALGPNDLGTARTDASVTAFGDGALVAGGLSNDGQVLATAEVYSTANAGFDPASISLSGPRTRHGAVVLPGGQTLLVGGQLGTDATVVLRSMEIVDPVLRKSIPEGVGELAMPRRNPTVMRLASGEILVAGGFDGSGNPVPWLEWFNADATPSASKKPLMLAQGPMRAFVALEGGGALAVVTPPAPTPSFQNVWVIDATGAPDPATPIQGALTAPVLFGGAGGAPVLWTGDRWLQWQPYAAAFGALDVLDHAKANIGDATASPDPGLAMWLDATNQSLTLLRFDTRNPYSALPGRLLVTDTAETSPDRLGAASFDVDQGLLLPPGTPAVAVFVTDRTYADVALDVTAPTGALALVALRDDQGHELDVGGQDCAVPSVPGNPTTLHVERRGLTVTWSLDGGAATPCTMTGDAGARVSVGVRGQATAAAIVKDFRVTRLGTP